jgi:hypothetical protein
MISSRQQRATFAVFEIRLNDAKVAIVKPGVDERAATLMNIRIVKEPSRAERGPWRILARSGIDCSNYFWPRVKAGTS